MRSATILVVMISAAFIASADAQQMQMGPPLSNGSQIIGGAPHIGGTDYWSQCANEDHRRAGTVTIHACSRIIADRPGLRGTATGYYYRGLAHLDAGDAQSALSDFHASAEQVTTYVLSHRHDAGGYIQRGGVYLRTEDYDLARADYEAAIALEPDSARGHSGLGSVMFRRGDYAHAAAEFDRAQQLSPKDNSGDFSDARCAARVAAHSDLDAARALCDRAVANSGGGGDTLITRGYFHFMQNELDAAAADFSAALARDARSAAAIYANGVMSVRNGDADLGRAQIAHAESLDRHAVDYYANAGLRP